MHRRPVVLLRSVIAALAVIAVGLAVCWTGLRADSNSPRWATGTARQGRPPVPPADPGPPAVPHGRVGTGPAIPVVPGEPGLGHADPGATAGPGAAAGPGGPPAPPQSPGVRPDGPRPPRDTAPCGVGVKLVPTCGVLWGVAPGAHTERRGTVALRDFERKTGRTQAIFHAYHRGGNGVFPTRQEKALAREPGRPRILFLNWKPTGASWAKIAHGDRKTDKFLDRLAKHIRTTYPEQFFFTVHHEPEDDVRPKKGSGYTARDYAAMFRHVVKRLRAGGVDNLVSVVVHMAYAPLTSRPWFTEMYPGDDVVDWVGFDTYAYSRPGYGHGDFAELVNRRAGARNQWPGFYNWATTRFPHKPLMVAEWGVWHHRKNPAHKAEFYRSVGAQIGWFPRIKALVHFDTPNNQKGWDSRVDATREGLAAYRQLGALPVFQVALGAVRPARPGRAAPLP
jgi:hypothetical protein